jgi:hypothetical protein
VDIWLSAMGIPKGVLETLLGVTEILRIDRKFVGNPDAFTSSRLRIFNNGANGVVYQGMNIILSVYAVVSPAELFSSKIPSSRGLIRRTLYSSASRSCWKCGRNDISNFLEVMVVGIKICCRQANTSKESFGLQHGGELRVRQRHRPVNPFIPTQPAYLFQAL